MTRRRLLKGNLLLLFNGTEDEQFLGWWAKVFAHPCFLKMGREMV